jgi:probable lipoprotein NlpC
MAMIRSSPSRKALSGLLCLLVVGLHACATGSGLVDYEQALVSDADVQEFEGAIVQVRHRKGQCCTMVNGSQRQHTLARAAAKFLGRSRIEASGRRFTYDCSGLARGVYFSAGIDLFDGMEDVRGANGVRMIYRHVRRYGVLHHGPNVRPGDLVFFHNTWDVNGNGRLDDLLTHIGVVEKVETDGTVVFVSRVSGGIERYRLNLRYPDLHKTSDGRIINDYMRQRRFTDPRGTEYLTGQLFSAFGTLVG